MGIYSELAIAQSDAVIPKYFLPMYRAAFDPNYPSVMEKRNMLHILEKDWYLTNIQEPEENPVPMMQMRNMLQKLRNIMDENNVSFQTAELGKVDQGGGGTIAYILANYDMHVIDSGVAVLNMHAPWEIISKVDLYEAICRDM